jgi:hypothetical protein
MYGIIKHGSFYISSKEITLKEGKIRYISPAMILSDGRIQRLATIQVPGFRAIKKAIIFPARSDVFGDGAGI